MNIFCPNCAFLYRGSYSPEFILCSHHITWGHRERNEMS